MGLLKSDFVVLMADMLVTVVLFKGTLLAGAFAVAVALARRTSAAARSSLWTVAFGSLLVLPLAWTVVPWWEAQVVAFPRLLFQSLPETLATSGTAGPAGMLERFVPDVLIRSGGPLASYLAVAWIAGVFLSLGRFLLHRLAAERVARRGWPVGDRRCTSLVHRIRSELAIARPVRLVYTDTIATPATFGIRRPVLLLPAAARRWSDERLEAVLYHELAHVQRHDYAGLLLVEVIRAVYWLNPVVLLAARRARETQDHACDDAALRSGVGAAAYARHLVEVARTLGAREVAVQAALPLIRRPGVRARVKAVLDRDCDRGPVSGRMLARAAGLALLLSAGLGSANLWVCEAETTPSVSTTTALPDHPPTSGAAA